MQQQWHCGMDQIQLEIWTEPNLAGFLKNGQMPDLSEPKSGTTLSKINFWELMW